MDGSPLEGTLFAGRYRVQERLGAGGYGEVYLAWHEVLRRRVALKLLHAPLQADPKALARFRREARAASGVRHPNIPYVHDFGYTEQGRPYLVMDHAPGRTLGELLAEVGPLPVGRCVHISCQVAAALDAAHRAGVLHRDLKPDNVMLGPGQAGDPAAEGVMVLDFGLAKIMTSQSAELTTEGAFHGTPEYLPPELIEGEELDPRADLYSLGVLAFEMLAGRVPFRGRLVQVLSAHLEATPAAPSEVAGRRDVPAALDRLVLRCLAKDPARRPASAARLEHELARCLP